MDLSYPVGRFVAPSAWTTGDRAAAIDTIAALPAALRAAVGGLSEAQLDTPYRPGGWTVRQLVHHVADSHANAYIRMRLALTEDNPTIKPYDQEAWAELPDARTVDVDVSLQLIDALHMRWAALLRGLTAAQFTRPYLHPESGPQTIDSALANYAWHCRHHTAHITSLRERNRWT